MMVDYAKEYGIDLAKLQDERPGSFTQMMIKRDHDRRAEEYWEMIQRIRAEEEARLREALTEYRVNLAESRRKLEQRKAQPVKQPVKRSLAKPKPEKLIKVGNYKFSQKQLQIAQDSLNRKLASNK